ncbi:hypothetical protein RI103_10030 [Paraburkholderia sp. FT54]|uniref:hypothetical protein n=1 Tax=Paraburkholderia sp. FT54 TaxID=3074437 RepID=UPI002877AF01|nr:hypothetical protein [Paraburkholderia sp. FT54]WNC88091.1 hypothetical protein RI103_10030 [Paraburkholderia sp. FT54]
MSDRHIFGKESCNQGHSIISLIEAAILRQEPLLEKPVDLSRGESSRLYGPDGQIDSLTLVSVIVDIEDQIRLQFGMEVCLADLTVLPKGEAPFATVASLARYVARRLELALTSEI